MSEDQGKVYNYLILSYIYSQRASRMNVQLQIFID